MPKGTVTTKKERTVLKRYINRAVVREEDKEVLDRYSNTGFVSWGFNWDTMEEIAKLSDSGIKHLNR